MSKKSKTWTTDYVNRIVAAKAKAANKEILRMTEICLVCGWETLKIKNYPFALIV